MQSTESFRGMPVVRGVCPGCDKLINNGCSYGPEALLKKLVPKIIDLQKFVTES